MTNHTTAFFRSQSRWPLIADHMRTVPGVHWSGACSTGQEAWSLAITLCEAGVDGRVVATDADRSVLTIAARGVYPAHEVLSSVPLDVAVKYFDECRDGLRVTDTLRTLVDFDVLRLGRDPPPRCVTALVRNVWRFLTPAEQWATTELIRSALDPRGILYVGAADFMNEQLERTQIHGLTTFFGNTNDPHFWKPLPLESA
ncbi:hypothetical protein CH304_20130 [Rhodococcus sp. 15-649-1-2]|nr:CheR family methyltransferase [Rhodococcus sp. 15-649-1-2]OZE79282.1 hypothetical protein CH304_20130 [Rhodococcus sp. 15-649-1-2]